MIEVEVGEWPAATYREACKWLEVTYGGPTMHTWYVWRNDRTMTIVFIDDIATMFALRWIR